MIYRVGMAPRRPEVTVEEFRSRWGGELADGLAKVPEVGGYVQNFPVLDDAGFPLLGYPGFDGCAETAYADEDHMRTAVSSPEFAELQTVERRFVDLDRAGLLVGTERLTAGGEPPEEAVKLITFIRSHPRCQPADLAEVLTAEDLGGAATRHLVLADLEAQRPPAPPACADAVEIRYFGSLAEAQAQLASAGERNREFGRRGRAFGTVAVLAIASKVV